MRPDTQMLANAVRTLRQTQEAQLARWVPNSVDDRLFVVARTFLDFITAVLDPRPPPLASAECGGLAFAAVMHGRAVADLLAALTLIDADEDAARPNVERHDEATKRLTAYWIDAIARGCTDEQLPLHRNIVEYVREASALLSLAIRVLQSERDVALGGQPTLRVTDDDMLTVDDASAMLVTGASTALVVSARS